MALWLAALIGGGAGGIATGGSLASMARMRFRAWPLLVVALVLEAGVGIVPGWYRPVAAVGAGLAIAGWCAANWRTGRYKWVGQFVLGLGIMLNATVMAFNSGMPVSRSALGSAGLPQRMDVAKGDFYKHVAMTGHTRLAVLGDTLPVHFAHTVMSPGDLVMLAGIAAIAWAATKQAATKQAATKQAAPKQAATKQAATKQAATKQAARGVRLVELASRTPTFPTS